MSRGLGKRQQQIMKVLRSKDNWQDITSLAAYSFYPDKYWYKPDQKYYFDGIKEWPTYSQIITIHKAVNSLEKRGLVETRKRQPNWHSMGEPTHWKEVRVKA